MAIVSDQIGDFITRIRNAGQAGHKTVESPRSNLKVEIAKLLKDQGYIEDYQDMKDDIQGKIVVTLKYFNRKPVIKEIKRVSKPGRRIYASADKLQRVRNGLGISILSTSRGVITVKEAMKLNVGGEIICTVW